MDEVSLQMDEDNGLEDNFYGHSYDDIHNWTDLMEYLNQTFAMCEVDLDEKVKQVCLFSLYLIIFVVGLVGNLLVLWVNWQSRRSKSSVNLYILNMAVADFGVVISLPFWMLEAMMDYTWLYGGFLCKFTHYFYFANMFSSIFFLTALSVDRYLTLTSSSTFWRQNQQRIRQALCFGIWLLAAIFPLPEVVHMKVMDYSDPVCMFMAPFETYDEWALAVSLMTTILAFIIPFSIILVFNLMTAYHIKTSGRPESKKHCRLIYAYILTFLLSWLPYHVTLILLTMHGSYFHLNCAFIHILYFFYEIIDCISLIHCVANPILYNFLSKDFRGKFINAVVRYIPKEKIGGDGPAEHSTSTTEHSVVITKESSPQANA
ncbi:G-protein coupled receptor 182 [Bombina bombina]|uniref:G-protein coupled receptor 182 n=1 Tax=Bombina bombina TaxID=8345 RepID=UPI00235ACEED|nr:G-protein coupled receptor 182 [Bombina bombina]XP_053560953.1 G-protein coupled receptor 182 [Bombina bombina]